MPKKDIYENINEEIDEPTEGKTDEPVFENKIEELIEEPIKNKLALDSVQLTVRRVDIAGLFAIDNKGNGLEIPIPKKYKGKTLKAGDIILVSKSEL